MNTESTDNLIGEKIWYVITAIIICLLWAQWVFFVALAIYLIKCFFTASHTTQIVILGMIAIYGYSIFR
jgi:hypothetical protein